jgi:uncharacterized protein
VRRRNKQPNELSQQTAENKLADRKRANRMSDNPGIADNPGTADTPEIMDNKAEGRLEAEVDGVRAELIYKVAHGRLVIEHTRVPKQIGGRGIASKLVSSAVDKAVEEGLTVVPVCPFAGPWLRQHPDIASKVTIDWTGIR